MRKGLKMRHSLGKMLSTKSKLTKAEMGRYAKEHGLRVSGSVKDRLSDEKQPGSRCVKETAFVIAADIAESVGVKTVKDLYVDTAFELLKYCEEMKTAGLSEKVLPKTAIKKLIQEKKVTKDKTSVPVRSNPKTEELLHLLDSVAVGKAIDLAYDLMKDDGKSTLKDRYVAPIVNGFGKCP